MCKSWDRREEALDLDRKPAASTAVKHRGLDFRSAVCSLLYLALGTRGDVLFIVNKLAKACTAPGDEDFKALLWLFGYLRAEPEWGTRFYSDITESPISEILSKHSIPPSDIVVFTDASWQDCPDTGRSTTGFLIFYQGGVVDANSMLQIPIAMSSCEAEVMASCSGCMAAAHIHMLLYDMKHLGTKTYDAKKLTLPNPPTVIMVDNKAAVRGTRSKIDTPSLGSFDSPFIRLIRFDSIRFDSIRFIHSFD